uniref:Zinc finger MYND domain-containing protein 10 homolog n=1 Tax=Cacopsylla melanoneura TaxID=428564 RepID=A0A8D8ZEH4_9HEMI
MEEVRRLRTFPVADIGSLEWFSAQQTIINVHGAIVSELQHGDISPTASRVQEEDKTGILVQELIGLAAWKRHVLPEIKHKDTIGQVFPIYSILFYESVYSSVLLSVMYCHENDLVTLFEEGVLCELVDHCVAHLVLLIGMTNKKTPLNLNPTPSEEDTNLSNADRINRFEQDLQYRVSNILLSTLRLIIDHLEDLSLSLLTRIIQHHDVAMLLAHLVDNQAWLNTDEKGNEIKYTDSWTKVKPGDRFLLGECPISTK